MGPGSMPGSALWAGMTGMTEVECVCSDSTGSSEASTVEPRLPCPPRCLFRFSNNMMDTQARKDGGWGAAAIPGREEDKLRGLVIPEWLRQLRTQMPRESSDLCSSSLPTTAGIRGLCSAKHLTRGSQVMS